MNGGGAVPTEERRRQREGGARESAQGEAELQRRWSGPGRALDREGQRRQGSRAAAPWRRRPAGGRSCRREPPWRTRRRRLDRRR